jgi:hypothetical protein
VWSKEQEAEAGIVKNLITHEKLMSSAALPAAFTWSYTALALFFAFFSHCS